MSNMNFNCDVCGREVQGCTLVNGMKFCAKCYQETFGETEKDRKINDLQSQLAKKDRKINDLQSQLAKKEKESEETVTLYYIIDTKYRRYYDFIWDDFVYNFDVYCMKTNKKYVEDCAESLKNCDCEVEVCSHTFE